MKKADFTKVHIRPSITSEATIECNVKNELADIIYQQSARAQDMSLALKVCNSKGPIELEQEEIDHILKLSQNMMLPFQNAINELLKQKE